MLDGCNRSPQQNPERSPHESHRRRAVSPATRYSSIVHAWQMLRRDASVRPSLFACRRRRMSTPMSVQMSLVRFVRSPPVASLAAERAQAHPHCTAPGG